MPRGHYTACSLWSLEQVERHFHDFTFHPGDAVKGLFTAQSILHKKSEIGAAPDLIHLVSRLEDIERHAPVAPTFVSTRHFQQMRLDIVPNDALLRKKTRGLDMELSL